MLIESGRTHLILGTTNVNVRCTGEAIHQYSLGQKKSNANK
jgi:hypothetical protein